MSAGPKRFDVTGEYKRAFLARLEYDLMPDSERKNMTLGELDDRATRRQQRSRGLPEGWKKKKK